MCLAGFNQNDAKIAESLQFLEWVGIFKGENSKSQVSLLGVVQGEVRVHVHYTLC